MNEETKPLELPVGDLMLIDETKDYYNGQPAYKLLMGYLCAALGTCDEVFQPSGCDFCEYFRMHRNHHLQMFSRQALGHAFTACKKFFQENRATIEAATVEDNKWERAGHDFWLTRNHHGAGFWDGDWPEAAGETLTNAAHSYGETDLYKGDDKLLYFS